MIKIARSHSRFIILVLLLTVSLSSLATVEPYRNQLKGRIKKGDSLIVKDEKFRNPAFNWADMTNRSVINRLSFRLTQDTPMVFKKAFSCELDLKVEYFANPEQEEPITIDNVKLKINYSPDSGAVYKGEDVYNFSNGYWVKVTVNNISSPELNDTIPPVLELTGQVIVDRTYHIADGARIGLFGNLGQPTGMTQQRIIGGSSSSISPDFLHLSWEIPTGYEEFDLEWAVLDAGSEHEHTLQMMLTQAAPVTPEDMDAVFRNNATRVTIGRDEATYDIAMVYNTHYIVARIRGVSYDVGGYRKEQDWEYNLAQTGGYAIWEIPAWHQPNLNWQFSGTFAEDGKKKEVINYFDGSLRSRQSVTVNNQDQVAVIQETIYDEFGRPAASILPSPKIGTHILNYYDKFNINGNDKSYDYRNIRGTLSLANCENIPDPLKSTSGASQYYSPANALLSVQNVLNYNKYIPDAEGYPLSVTQYVNDNTGRIRLQGGVGKKFQPGMTGRALTKYYYGKPENWELDRLFGSDVGYSDHYLKNMVVDANGQVSISYLNASGKTIATALTGDAPVSLAGLESKAAPKSETTKILRPQQFVYDASALSLTAKTTYLASLPQQTVSFNYDIEQLIYTYQGQSSSFQICSNCYYDFSIRVLNDCGDVVYQTAPNTYIGSKLSNCNNNSPYQGSFNPLFKEVGEYYITFELKLNNKVINEYTENFIQQNTDLRSRFSFVLDYFNNTDFNGCFSECTTCKIALGTSTQFFNVIKDKLLEYGIDYEQLSQQEKTDLQTLANNKYNALSAQCQAMQPSCIVNSCSRYEKEMLLDVSPGGQFALFQLEPFALLEQDVNVLTEAHFRAKFPILSAGHPDYEANAIYLENGDKTSPHDASFTLEMLVKYWRADWAPRFLEYHPEKCKLDFCNTNSQYVAWDDQVKQIYNKAADIPQIPLTSGLQYNYNNAAWLLAQDPYFKPGAPGANYYAAMQADLNQFSTNVMSMNTGGMNPKSLTQVVDYLLYCADPSGNTSTGAVSNTWNNCTPKTDCRVPDREWQQYREKYFQLKEKYYAAVRNEGACTGKCQVGTPIGIAACASPSDFSFREASELSCQGGRMLKLVFAKGAATRPMTVELYYPAEYASFGIPSTISFNVGESFHTICVPLGMPINAIKVKGVTCTGNSTTPACQGISGQLNITAGGSMTGVGKFEQLNAGILSDFTIIPGRLDQPPAEASYCTGSTFFSKNFYNCYKVLLPGGASADFSNVWVITCKKDLCENEPVHSMTYSVGFYQYYKTSDGKYYFVVLQNGGGGTPSCSYDPPVYKSCLKVQVDNQAVQIFYNAALVSCNACQDPFGITPESDLGNNTWQMSDGVIYKVFPNTTPGYVPPTNGCSNPSYYWQPCFSVTLNGNTEYYASATVLTCYQEFDPCANPPIMEVTHRFGEYHYYYNGGGYQADYYIVDGDPNFPPSGEEYCVNTDMGFYDCITFEVPGQSSQSYYNVWVITCPFFGGRAALAATALKGDTTTTMLKSGAIRLYNSYAGNARSTTYLIKKIDTKDNAALKKALRPKRGFASYKFYKQFTLRKSPKAYQRFQNVWVARNIPRLNIRTTAAKKSVKTTTKSAVASSTLAGPCGTEQIQFTVGNIGYVNECGSEQLSISLVGGEPLCEGQFASVNVYMIDNQFHNMEEVGSVIIGPGQYSTTLCISHETAERAESWGGCGIISGTCEPTTPTCPDAFKYKQSRFPEINQSFSLTAQDITNLQNENLTLIQEQINTSCEAQADGWIAKMEECISAYPEAQREGMRNALRTGFIAICKRGGDITHPSGASTTRPGDANPSSFKQVIQSVFQLGSSLTMTCNPWLIDEPHPYEPITQDVPTILSASNADLCNRLQQLQTEYTANPQGATFYLHLKSKYGEAMNLSSSQFAALEKSCNNCRYLLAEEIPLPVFMEPGAVGCISATEYNNAKAALAAEFASWNVNHPSYRDILANYMNHRFGFAMSFHRYEKYEQDLLSNSSAILCNNPPYQSVEVDHYACVKTLMATAIINGTKDYDTYIAEEKRKFRLSYVNTCSLAKGNAIATSLQQQYHFTLYYYDQAGSLVRTVSPEGVRPLSFAEAQIVDQWRLFNSASCTGVGIPSVSNKTATLNILSAALQNNTVKSLEMWLYSNVNDDTRQVRIITPDNKYLYQAAVSGNKLWVELYTLLPTPVLTKRAVADITSVNLQPWSHLLVNASNFVSGAWTVYLEGKKLTLMTSGLPAYPFDFPPAATIPPERLDQLKHLRIYNQQPANDAAVFANYSNSCMYPEGNFAAALTHWGRFNIPKACSPAMETRIVNNQGALQVTGNLGMDGNRFPDVKDNFTVELWVNPTQPHDIDPLYPLGTGFDGTDGQHYVIYPTSGAASGGSAMGISVGTNGVSVYEHADSYMPALLVWQGAINGWKHIAVVYENKTPRLYVDGVLQAIGVQSPKQFVIPGSNISSGPYGFMQGGIDEVRIWDKVRSGDEIRNSYESSVPTTTSGLVAYWPFTKQDGEELSDLTCNEYAISPATAGYTWNTTSLPQELKDIVAVEYAVRGYYPSHKLTISYAYNSAGQEIQQKSPDGGESYFWYDRLSRLIASQNEEQRTRGNVYSYTRYEPVLSRIIEVGEKVSNQSLLGTPGFVHEEQAIESFKNGGTNNQLTQTIYDDKPPIGFGIEVGLTQNNLRKRVSATFYKETSNGAVLNASYYDYDLLGNVKTLYQQVEGLSLRRIDYEYDLVSGKMNLVRYQQGQNDQFYYIYKYDAENRLTEARTDIQWDGTNGVNSHLNAAYRYYLHGPLARVELGSPNKVQGLDYAYTLQGWLKGVNGDKLKPADDIGLDGFTGNTNIAKDVFAYSFGYYNGDYKPISTSANAFSLKYGYGSQSGDVTGKELFNGNIAHTTLAISRFRNGDPVGYSYGYDQLNRLKEMRQHVLAGSTTNWNSSTITDAYKETITYDANGNIKTYNRNGDKVSVAESPMDKLTYGYNTATDAVSGLPYLTNNRLRHVTEDLVAAPADRYTGDIDGQWTDYYTYDKIGNLVAEGYDVSTQTCNQCITWTAYGKIKSIKQGPVADPDKIITYSYDPAGNRVRKVVTAKVPNQPGTSTTTTTWYMRDAQGNVLGLYSKKDAGPIKWKEQHLYGSSRIGMWQPDIDIATTPGSSEWTTVGKRSYELTNHLGNVLAVITDKRTTGTGGIYEADVITAHDYYSFGMQMPGRSIDASDRDEVVQDLTQLIVASDLNSGITPLSGNRYLHNGLTWQQQATGIVSVVNGAFRVENSGLSGSDGMLVIVPSSMIQPFTTYMMECDILEQSPGITEYNIQALSQTGDGYRVSIVQSGIGHRSIVFTTGASVGNYVALRISARPSTAGLYFIVDNFVFKKYQVVNQAPVHVTDFNSAAMSGVNVNDNGQLWMPLNESITSLSVTGTTDKKIQVNGTNFNESYLIRELPIEGGKPHLLKFTVGQLSTDKRLYLQLKVRTGTGAWQFTNQSGFFYLGSGDFQLNFTLPAGIDQVRIEFLRQDPGIPVESYTIDNFSLIRLEPVLTQTPGCHEVVQDLTELKASSDLNTGAVQNGWEVNHNGVKWARMTATSTITLYNQAIKCENGGGSSDGVIAYIPSSGIEANATYIMEIDIIDKSPTITYFTCQAHTNGDSPYRVMTRKTGLGHHSIIFTTPSVLPQYIRIRISANQIGVGTWFVVDNFVVRKYQVVNESQTISTDFNEAVVNGVTVNSDGMAWSNFNTIPSSLSLVGTTDKKLMVTCTNMEESRIKGDFDLAGGANYILRFSMAQDIEEKRLNLRMYSYTNGVWTSIESLTSIYMRSGDQIFNFTHPVGATRLRLEFLRSNSGESYDGYNVPYTLDNVSISRLEPIASQTTIVCDPNADPDPGPGSGPDPSGENSIYRYGFNGQEKSNEIKGVGNSYTAEFWEYDPRIARRWDIDPVVKVWESPYAAFNGNPIYSSDPDGLNAEKPGDPIKTLEAVVVVGKRNKNKNTNQSQDPPVDYSLFSNFNKPKPFPKFKLRIGDSYGPVGPDARTSIWGLYGGRRYYNSTPNGEPGGIAGFIENMTEPNAFIQFQIRIGGKDSKEQIAINWFKQKFKPFSDGFRYEAPTALEFGYSRNMDIGNIGKNINISNDLSVSAGPSLGKPMFDDPAQGTAYPRGPQFFGYRIIGVGASVISRVDATFFNRYTFFVAGTVHHLQTFEQNTSNGTQPSRAIGSLSLTTGIGVDIGGIR